MAKYNKRVFLNKEDSPSTGNVVAFDGVVDWKGEKIRSMFLSISDCAVSVRLHKTDDDTPADFVDKMVLLRDTIDSFIEHLNSNK